MDWNHMLYLCTEQWRDSGYPTHSSSKLSLCFSIHICRPHLLDSIQILLVDQITPFLRGFSVRVSVLQNLNTFQILINVLLHNLVRKEDYTLQLTNRQGRKCKVKASITSYAYSNIPISDFPTVLNLRQQHIFFRQKPLGFRYS